jgi:hypothetical protein
VGAAVPFTFADNCRTMVHIAAQRRQNMDAIARNPQPDNRFAAPQAAAAVNASAAYNRNATAQNEPAAEPDNETTVTLSPRAQALAQQAQAASSSNGPDAAAEAERNSSEQRSQLNAQVRRAYLSE